jgi:hypothetical protein
MAAQQRTMEVDEAVIEVGALQAAFEAAAAAQTGW